MAATPENSLLNMRTASANVRRQLGLSDQPGTWTYEQRVSFNKELAAEVLRYPNSFTDDTVASARAISDKTYASLSDASIDWGAFAADVAEEVGFNLKGLVLTVAIVAAVAYVLPRALADAKPAVA